jgi:hypothetical protein
MLVFARTDGPRILADVQRDKNFRIAEFGVRAAVEVANWTARAIADGDKREGVNSPWQKVKFDRQICAIGKVEGASAIYSDDDAVVSTPLTSDWMRSAWATFNCLRNRLNAASSTTLFAASTASTRAASRIRAQPRRRKNASTSTGSACPNGSLSVSRSRAISFGVSAISSDHVATNVSTISATRSCASGPSFACASRSGS